MNGNLLQQVLASKNALCLLPLIEMIGDLDELVENGFKKFSNDIPNKIKLFQHELNDIDHILEDTYDVLADKQLINYSKRRGEIRRARRIKKNEGVFLGRNGIEELLVNFMKLLSEAEKSITDVESQVYLTRVLSAPECSTKVISSINSQNQSISNTGVTHNLVESSEAIIEEPIKVVAETSNHVVTEEVEVIDKDEKVSNKREYTIADINNSPKDSMVVKEGIIEYRNKITLDASFDMTKLLDDWKELFAKADVNFKKDILLDAYIEFYSNPKNPMEKCVADFAVWNHLLPKLLLKTEYYSK